MKRPVWLFSLDTEEFPSVPMTTGGLKACFAALRAHERPHRDRAGSFPAERGDRPLAARSVGRLACPARAPGGAARPGAGRRLQHLHLERGRSSSTLISHIRAELPRHHRGRRRTARAARRGLPARRRHRRGRARRGRAHVRGVARLRGPRGTGRACRGSPTSTRTASSCKTRVATADQGARHSAERARRDRAARRAGASQVQGTSPTRPRAAARSSARSASGAPARSAPRSTSTASRASAATSSG